MTIDEVIIQLTEIMNWARTESSKLGYFAALYRKVTLRVKEGIGSGRFQNGPRMEQLDVMFASRYLDALAAFRHNKSITHSWQVAFTAASRRSPIILQHLLVGMNAHINLDLGIAAAQVAPGPALAAMEHDFNEINHILGSLISDVEKDLAEVSPWIGWLETIGGKADDKIVEFSLKAAREFAWTVARTLAPLTPEQQADKINDLDRGVSLLGNAIVHPPFFLRSGLLIIRSRESNDVAHIIDVLS